MNFAAIHQIICPFRQKVTTVVICCVFYLANGISIHQKIDTTCHSTQGNALTLLSSLLW